MRKKKVFDYCKQIRSITIYMKDKTEDAKKFIKKNHCLIVLIDNGKFITFLTTLNFQKRAINELSNYFNVKKLNYSLIKIK